DFSDNVKTLSASRQTHFIGKKENIIQDRRVVKSVGERDVLVIYHQGDFYAIDVRCYHSGGPLQEGDIEDFDGRPSIECPWHKYKITLAEGESLYQAVDPSVKPLKPTWCSKGVKQRVHTVTLSNEDVNSFLKDWPKKMNHRKLKSKIMYYYIPCLK
uniref:Rieske domain-containing protein n=1 Tax=Sinocyclocheilus grahami TaxID=75366 RepID=A0A672Q9X0_SINGR